MLSHRSRTGFPPQVIDDSTLVAKHAPLSISHKKQWRDGTSNAPSLHRCSGFCSGFCSGWTRWRAPIVSSLSTSRRGNLTLATLPQVIDDSTLVAKHAPLSISHKKQWRDGTFEDGLLLGLDSLEGCWQDVVDALSRKMEEQGLKSSKESSAITTPLGSPVDAGKSPVDPAGNTTKNLYLESLVCGEVVAKVTDVMLREQFEEMKRGMSPEKKGEVRWEDVLRVP